jgi:hypothetical protein
MIQEQDHPMSLYMHLYHIALLCGLSTSKAR